MAVSRIRRGRLHVAVGGTALLVLLVACTASGSGGDRRPPRRCRSLRASSRSRPRTAVRWSSRRPDRTGVKELVSGSACCSVLSLDGTRLAFLTQTSKGRETAATMTVDGGDSWVIAPPPGLTLLPGAWAVDGVHLWLGAIADKPGRSGVVLSGPHGEDLVWLTHPPGRAFDLPLAASPDGTRRPVPARPAQ